MYVHLCLCICVYLTKQLYPFVCLSSASWISSVGVCVCTYVCLCLSVRPSVRSSVRLSVCLSLCLSLSLSLSPCARFECVCACVKPLELPLCTFTLRHTPANGKDAIVAIKCVSLNTGHIVINADDRTIQIEINATRH